MRRWKKAKTPPLEIPVLVVSEAGNFSVARWDGAYWFCLANGEFAYDGQGSSIIQADKVVAWTELEFAA